MLWYSKSDWLIDGLNGSMLPRFHQVFASIYCCWTFTLRLWCCTSYTLALVALVLRLILIIPVKQFPRMFCHIMAIELLPIKHDESSMYYYALFADLPNLSQLNQLCISSLSESVNELTFSHMKLYILFGIGNLLAKERFASCHWVCIIGLTLWLGDTLAFNLLYWGCHWNALDTMDRFLLHVGNKTIQ